MKQAKARPHGPGFTEATPLSKHSSSISAIYDAALDYTRRNWAVIPLPYRQKRPTVTGWQNVRLAEADLPIHFNGHSQNIGVLLGAPSGGLVDVDLDSPEAVAAAPVFLPNTRLIGGREGRPGSHYFYCVGDPPKKASWAFDDPCRRGKGARLLELRSNGGQTVVPPSGHPEGGSYRWDEYGEPARLPVEELRRAVVIVATAALMARYWPAQGQRHDIALHWAGLLLQGGVEQTVAERLVDFAAKWAGDEGWRGRALDVQTTAARVKRGGAVSGRSALAVLLGSDSIPRLVETWLALSPAPHAGTGMERFNLSDAGNGEIFAHIHGENARFDHKRGRWLLWTKHCWREDATERVYQMAKDTARWRYHRAEQLPDLPERAAEAKWAVLSENRSRIEAMLALARTEAPIADSGDGWDANQWLLCVPNGVIDLRTGRLRSGRPDDRITKQSPAVFDPAARCPVFERFLERVQPDLEMRAYLQRRAGYALTGSDREQDLAFFYGSGRNGKGTFVNALRAVLGPEYATLAAPGLLLQHRGDRHPTEIADLEGRRLVVSVEVDEASALAEGLVKQLTGGDGLKGRGMGENFREIAPTQKYVLQANYKPELHGRDTAIWDRIRVIPWEVYIAPEERDRELPSKLEAEAPGILNWMITGCLDWQAHGMQEPQLIRAATQEYREESDPLADFLAERCVLEPGGTEGTSELHDAYVWAGGKPLSLQAFGSRLSERGFGKERDGKTGRWLRRGIRLRKEGE